MKIVSQRRLPFRSQGKLSILVVGFFMFYFLSSGTFAQQYQLVYSEDFGTQPNGPLTGSWNQRHFDSAFTDTWTISSGWAITTGNYRDNVTLFRPSSEAFRNGKIQFVGASDGIIALWSRVTGSATQASGYEIWVGIGAGYIYTHNANNSIIPSPVATPLITGLSLNGKIINGEMVLQTNDDTTSTMTLTLYDNATQTFLRSGTETFSTPSFTGQRGVGAYNSTALKSIAFYKEIESLTTAFIVNETNIKVGTPIIYTVTTSEPIDTVYLSDNGAGGIFDTQIVILDHNNNWIATGTYTPTKAGNYTLTASFDSTGDKTIDIQVIPYSTTIGFIGDSVTQQSAIQDYISALLGNGFFAVNVAAPGSSTQGRATNSHNGTSVMTNAVSTFSASGIEIVHIMLGTNDAAGNVSSGIYKINMQTIIDTLKSAGIKHVLISGIPYIATNDLNNGDTSMQIKDASVRAYQQVNAELIAENSGFVLSGDVQAYQWFKEHQDELANDYHPNTTGYNNLRNFRVQILSGNIHYQISPDHHFTGSSNHTLGTSGSLTFRVDKYFGEFSDVVKVDASPLTSSQYEATSGSTTIELKADYLNTLSTGSHTLSVGFEGGVWVEEDFTILPDPTIVTPTPSQPSQPASPSYSGGGGGGASLSKDNCPNGDFSASYYDKTCGTTADLADEVAKKVNVLKPLIVRIFLTATEEQKALVHDIITSCSQTNKKEIIKLACQELVEKWEF